MQSFEVIVNRETYKIIQNNPDDSDTFSVINYTMCHIVKRNISGKWEPVEHRFGTEDLPLQEIGDAIDRYFNTLLRNELPSKAKNKAQLSNDD